MASHSRPAQPWSWPAAPAAATDAAEPAPTFDPDEEVTLDLAFWGNDVRADLYNQAIDGVQRGVPQHHGQRHVPRLPRVLGEAPDRGGRREPARRDAVRLLVPAPVLGEQPAARPRPLPRQHHRDRAAAGEHPRHRRRQRHDLRHPHLHERVGPLHQPGAAREGRRRGVRRRQLGGLRRVDGRGHRRRRRRVLGRRRLHRPHPELRAAAALRGRRTSSARTASPASTRSASTEFWESGRRTSATASASRSSVSRRSPRRAPSTAR